MAFSLSRLERLYLQNQPTFGIIPNTSGTATLGNADACRFIRLSMESDVALLTRPDKTGTRSAQGAISGRRFARWTCEMSLVGNGVAGVEPDNDPLLRAIFGNTPTIGAGSVAITSSTDAAPIVVTCGASHGLSDYDVVYISGHLTNVAANGPWVVLATTGTTLTLLGSSGSGAGAGSGGTVSKVNVSYTLTDDVTQFTMWAYRSPAGLDQRVIDSAVLQEATLNLGQDIATWSCSGEGRWVLRSSAFASSTLEEKAGLVAFPAEPSTPTTSGSIIPGFTGRFVMGPSSSPATAETYNTIRTATITLRTENAIVKDTFGSYYGDLTEGDERNFSISFNIYDDESVRVATIKRASEDKTPQDIIIQIGTVPGNTWFAILRNVYLSSHVLGDGQLRFDATFNESRATATNLAVRDEFKLAVI